MNILEKNLTIFPKLKEFVDAKVDYIDMENTLKHGLLGDVKFNLNRALYLGIDIMDLSIIDKLLNSTNEKALTLLWYRDIRDLKIILNTYDFSENGNIGIFHGDVYSEEAKNRFIGNFQNFVYTFTNIVPVIRESKDLEYVTNCTDLLKFIRNYKEDFQFLLGNDLNDTLQGIRNRIINAKKMIENPGIKEVVNHSKKQFKNKPAIIVSSGPSLDKNLHKLKGFENQCLIMSCDGSLTSLRKKNIVPHMVGTVERCTETYRAFYEEKIIDKNIVYFGPGVVLPEIPNHFDNKIVSFYKDSDVYGKWMNQTSMETKGLIWCGTSIAHMLMNIAVELECSPIILIGQDLAYSKDLVSHARDAEVVESVQDFEINEYVESIYGEMLPTNFAWKNFKSLFEVVINEKKLDVIDATEGGAKIKGTRIMSLDEALGQYCNEQVPALREIVDSIEVSMDYQVEAMTHTNKEIVNLIKEFDHLLEQGEEAAELNKEAIILFNDGIESQEALDEIYHAIDFAEDLAKEIMGNKRYAMLFQYPVFQAIEKINGIDTDVYTMQSLKHNIEVQRDLLANVVFFSKQMIKLLIDNNELIKDDYLQYSIDYQTYDRSKYAEWINKKEYEIRIV